MNDVAISTLTVQESGDQSKVLRGAINLIARVVPLIFEDKEFFMRSMWHEQAFFNN